MGLGVCLLGVLLAVVSSRPESVPPPSPRPPPGRVPVPGGRLTVAPNDWEALGKVTPREVEVSPFQLDRYEVTNAEYSTCRECVPRSADLPPELPVTNIHPAQARRYCLSRGGRLPTHAEWMFAAASPEGYRYPWGHTGLVCRKAVFGTVDGPCSSGGDRPSPVGMRPLGATPTGLYDLCGNVAEWVTQGASVFAAGGSFRSTLAGQLKVWSHEDTSLPRDDIGFRCAYDH